MDKIKETVNAALVSRLLLVGYDYAIFDFLKKPIQVADLAKNVNCDERYLREWCEALKVSFTIKPTSCNYVSVVWLFAMGQRVVLFQLVE